MNKEIVSSRITKFKFLQLYVSVAILKGKQTVIDKDQLEEKLFEVYKEAKYRFLFEDITISESTESKRVNLSDAFSQALTWGLLNLNEDGRYIVAIAEKEARRILTIFNGNDAIAMNEIVEKVNPSRFNTYPEYRIKSMEDYIVYLKNFAKNDPEEAKRLANEALLRTGVIDEDGSLRGAQLEKTQGN